MATADKTENKTKVLVNVYEPLIAIMKHKFDAACLKRDAYLDKALRIEAVFLRSEVKESNSDRSRNFIAENLKELKLKPLSLSLSTETVELVNEVCKEKNIPRDSFINRFFLLLVASETILKALFLFHKVKIEDIEEAFICAKEGWWLNCERIEQINILDLFESFSEKPPLLEIRELLCEREFDIVQDGCEANINEVKKITTYNHKFEKNCFCILPDDYSFIKTNNLLGLNMYMSDEDVDREEVLGRNVTLAKTELDRLLAFAKSEKTRKIPKKEISPTKGESQ